MWSFPGSSSQVGERHAESSAYGSGRPYVTRPMGANPSRLKMPGAKLNPLGLRDRVGHVSRNTKFFDSVLHRKNVFGCFFQVRVHEAASFLRCDELGIVFHLAVGSRKGWQCFDPFMEYPRMHRICTPSPCNIYTSNVCSESLVASILWHASVKTE